MDVVALGELLIDFTENGTSAQDNKLFEANPGGAPCNVLAMLQKLGHQTAFIGKVGQDAFGRLLVDAVKEQGIDTTGVRYDDNVHTTLAFVQTAADGDRDFSFYRNPGADMMLTADEVDLSLVRNAKIFHFGSLSMTDKICENATKHAIAAAKEAGALISFDPNLRKPLWKSMDDAKEKISWGLSQCDILKISDDEIEFMTGEKDIKTGVKKLIDEYHETLYQASGSKVLAGVLTDFHNYVQRARKSSIVSEERARKSIREHRQILRAIKDRDAEMAEQLANEHIIHVMQNLKKQGY